MAPFLNIFSVSGLGFSHFFHTLFFSGDATSCYFQNVTRLYNDIYTAVIVFRLTKMSLFDNPARVNLFTVACLEIASKKRFGQN